MDESVRRNLDTQHRRLTEAEAELAALLAGETPPSTASAQSSGELSYDELTARNDALRAQRSWLDIDLDDALGPEERAAFDRWCSRRRVSWQLSDVAAVGLAGILGSAAVLYDDTVDGDLLARLKRLKDTEAFRRFEKAGHGLAIDYMGPGFGGRAHRVRSAGHDLVRPFAALRQIRSGNFEGVEWVDHVRHRVFREGVRTGVAGRSEALGAWAQHLAADVVTPMSLPLPGWSLLYELPWKEARQFAHKAYAGPSSGQGLNLRSGLLSPSLPVLTTEVVVRTHVHGRVWAASGTAMLDQAQTSLRNELLLASHALVGAFALGKVTAAMLASPGGPITVAGAAAGVRHLHLPVLVRVGQLALQAAVDARAREDAAAPSWGDLLGEVALPWQLDEARAVEDSVAAANG